MEVEDCKQKNIQTFQDILWGVKTMKLKLVNKPVNNLFEIFRDKLVNYFVKEGLLQSLSLSKVSYYIILDDYIHLCKRESPEKVEIYTKNLFKKDIVIQQHLKTMLKKNIQEKIVASINYAIKNISYLLKFKAGLRKEMDNNYFDVMDECYQDLYFLFEEFVNNHFKKFIDNLLIPLNEDSIIFDDALKQDEYYFIIVYPEEYLMNKFSDYTYQQQSVEYRDKTDILHLSKIFLEDNNTSKISKEDILQMMSDIEGKQSQSIILNPNKLLSRKENHLQNNLINQCNPFLKKDSFLKQSVQQQKK